MAGAGRRRRSGAGRLSELGWVAVAVLAAALAWRLLARRAEARRRPEHAVILHLELRPPSPDPEAARARLARLTEALGRAAADRRAGEVEPPLGEGDRAVISLYGPDADRLLEAVRPVLAGQPFGEGSHAICRHGEPGAPEERRALSPSA